MIFPSLVVRGSSMESSTGSIPFSMDLGKLINQSLLDEIEIFLAVRLRDNDLFLKLHDAGIVKR